MNRKTNWKIAIGTLFLVAITTTTALIPGVMADGDAESLSVNINTADAVELTLLPGIGASKATAIINYRALHGPFETVDDLTKIQGIGENILEKIRDIIRTD